MSIRIRKKTNCSNFSIRENHLKKADNKSQKFRLHCELFAVCLLSSHTLLILNDNFFFETSYRFFNRR